MNYIIAATVVVAVLAIAIALYMGVIKIGFRITLTKD